MNSTFTPVALEHASRLLNHGPTVLVTSSHGGRRNVMAVAWSMPVEFSAGRWDFRADNAALHTLHHLGAGNCACADRVIRAKVL